jgi:hypothetical protein
MRFLTILRFHCHRLKKLPEEPLPILQEMAYPAVTRCATSSRHPLSAFLTFEQAQIISGYTTR